MCEASRQSPAELIRWYVEAGADEAIDERPHDCFKEHKERNLPPDQPPARPGPSRPHPVPRRRSSESPSSQGVSQAVALASEASNLDQLRNKLMQFDGCSLASTATNLVFGTGSPNAPVVIIGEAPGAEEDRQGLPFVGPSGRLLDKMLESIGHDRSSLFITNTVFWRPPGNRSPTSNEVAVCLPFIERLIELIHPGFLVALGGPAAGALLGQSSGVSKLRGHWFSYQTPGLSRPVQATAMFHPAYLLRSPAQKRLAWRDLLALRRAIDERTV